MPTLTLHPSPRLRADIARHIAMHPQASITAASLVRDLLEEHLADLRAARAKATQAMLLQYLPVVRAVAARTFARCKGAVPLEELQSAAYEEAAKAAHRYDPATGYSPAPFLRRWAEWGVAALLRARQEEGADLRPDQLEPGAWERMGGATETPSVEGGDLQQALGSWGTKQQRHIVALVAQGHDYDAVAIKVGTSTGWIRATLDALRLHLHAHGVDHTPDEELTIPQAAARTGLSPKALAKRLRKGTLRGRKEGGEWLICLSDINEK